MVEMIGEVDGNGHAQGEFDPSESQAMVLIVALYMLKKYGEQEISMAEMQQIERDWDSEVQTMDVCVLTKSKVVRVKTEVK